MRSKAIYLTPQELKRYNRQMMLEGWGKEGQKKLKSACVFVAGAGGLGSPVTIYLTVAGVGKIRLCDFDTAELSNLNRQILHHDARLGENKALSAKKTLKILNPSVEIEEFPVKITEENVDGLVGESQIIVDCLDNFPTRFVLNACAIRKAIPFIYASIWGLTGYMTFIDVPSTPCLACIFPEAPPPEVFPVVGVTPGVMGCLQATEVLKFLTGLGENLKNKLLIWDGLKMKFRTSNISRDKNCRVCAK